jgi:hypothetical protein
MAIKRILGRYGHLFDTGVVGVTISEIGGYTVVSVHGCGQNTDPFCAELNTDFGPGVFQTLAESLQQMINPAGNISLTHH